MNNSTDSEIAQRHGRRLAALEVRVAELELDARRTLAYGPILLLVLANVTPLVIADARNEADEAFTLFQGARGALPGSGPAEGWFLLLGLAGLVLGVAGILFSADRSTGFRWFVLASATVLLVLLAAFVMARSRTRPRTCRTRH
jgi:hypothetical protein